MITINAAGSKIYFDIGPGDIEHQFILILNFEQGVLRLSPNELLAQKSFQKILSRGAIKLKRRVNLWAWQVGIRVKPRMS